MICTTISIKPMNKKNNLSNADWFENDENWVGKTSTKVTNRNVPAEMACKKALHISTAAFEVFCKSDMKMPMAMPKGDAQAKIKMETAKNGSLESRRFKAKENAIRALWVMTAKKRLINCSKSSWSPMANPSKMEWKDKAIRSIKDLRWP